MERGRRKGGKGRAVHMKTDVEEEEGMKYGDNEEGRMELVCK